MAEADLCSVAAAVTWENDDGVSSQGGAGERDAKGTVSGHILLEKATRLGGECGRVIPVVFGLSSWKQGLS